MTDETLFRSATSAAKMLRCNEISSTELTTVLLERIEAVNPMVNAIVELAADKAAKAARDADRALARGERVGPLHGGPMTIKDSFDVAGLHATWGNPAFADFVAGTDAAVVRRLRRAGAIIVGKTNVHVMLADFGQTANEVYGRTSNPWDVTRTPGGSTRGGARRLGAVLHRRGCVPLPGDLHPGVSARRKAVPGTHHQHPRGRETL